MKTINKEDFYNKKTCTDWQNKIGVEEYEKNRLKNWAYIDGKYYYIKDILNYNEIIGEIIADSLNLDSAHYEIGKYKRKNKYMTENFKKPGKEYLKIYQTELNNRKDILDIVNNDLKHDLLKMYALDIFMMQTDRCNVNLMFVKENNKLRLAPLYDYSYSYLDLALGFIAYRNCIRNVYMTENAIGRFMNDYPEIVKYMNIILNKDYLTLLKNELLKYEIELSKKEEKNIEREFEEGSKILKRMVR
jgi:hypothetical protein